MTTARTFCLTKYHLLLLATYLPLAPELLLATCYVPLASFSDHLPVLSIDATVRTACLYFRLFIVYLAG